MNTKSMARVILLGVVGMAVGAWAVKEFGPDKAVVGDNGRKAADQFVRPDGVTVINFHGEKRCRTCIGIGTQAKKAIDEEFAAEAKAGKVRWELINYEEPANAHYVKEYELVSSTVLVTLWKGGKEVKWNRLDGVWDHVGDEPVFRAYVARGVRDLLDQP